MPHEHPAVQKWTGTSSLRALLNFVQNRIFEEKKGTRSRISVLKLYTDSVNSYTHSVKLYKHREIPVPNLGRKKFR